MEFGRFNEGRIGREWLQLGDGSEALVDPVEPAAAMGIVELAQGVGAGFLELARRWLG